jgi:hypothetical protein
MVYGISTCRTFERGSISTGDFKDPPESSNVLSRARYLVA